MFKKIVLAFLITAASLKIAAKGTSSGGGGDDYTIDFLQTLETEVVPWLFGQNSHVLPKGLTKSIFEDHISAIAKRVESKPAVFESCDNSTNGRQVVVCYNYIEDKYYISRSLYPLDKKNSLSKWLLLAHEMKRRITIDQKPIEGDNYEVTRKLSIQSTNPELMTDCIIQLYSEAGFSSPSLRRQAFLTCERTAADLPIRDCIVKLVKTLGFESNVEKLEATHVCEVSLGDSKLIEKLTSLKTQGLLTGSAERTAGLELWFDSKR